MLDLKIVNGTIVDGSGVDRFRGDVGVKDGRIVAVGEVTDDARETIDASGRIVAPGFIDIHTHYDAQVFWDPALSPSCFHGVTSVIGGFCGFSIAPMSPDAATYICPMLARVEGMPLSTLEAAVPWNTWQSFGEFLDLVEGKIGLNAGFFAGHSAIRRVVMGERAVGEEATPEELERMKDLLGKSLAEGALGFSSTISPTHNDADGNPVPSRWASHDEILELGRVVSQYEGTGIELLPNLEFGPGIPELITELSIVGNRAVNWNALAIMGWPDARQRAAKLLSVTDYARERGGEVIALTIPCTPALFLNYVAGGVLDANPGIWREIFKWPLAERIERLKDPALRQQMREDAAKMPATSPIVFASQLDNFEVVVVEAEKNKKYVGRLTGDIAKEEGRDPLDVMLDIALDDDLRTTFSPNMGGYDQTAYEIRGELWRDDRTLIGASDAGAHLDAIETFAFSTTVLQKGVREHQVITLEEAVYQMTDRPARYMGLIDRGLLKPGYHADIVVFDEATVGRGPTYLRYDVPGGEMRVYADAEGIDHVIVNGVEIVRHNQHTGALPGQLFRSGRDTRTVALDEMQEGRASELEVADA